MAGTDANPAAGIGLLAVLIYTGYWVVRSRRRWRTILYALLALGAPEVAHTILTYVLLLLHGAAAASNPIVTPRR
jgi:hypothetical protein